MSGLDKINVKDLKIQRFETALLYLAGITYNAHY